MAQPGAVAPAQPRSPASRISLLLCTSVMDAATRVVGHPGHEVNLAAGVVAVPDGRFTGLSVAVVAAALAPAGGGGRSVSSQEQFL